MERKKRLRSTEKDHQALRVFATHGGTGLVSAVEEDRFGRRPRWGATSAGDGGSGGAKDSRHLKKVQVDDRGVE